MLVHNASVLVPVLLIVLCTSHCSLRADDLAEDLAKKSGTLGLALVAVRGWKVDIIKLGGGGAISRVSTHESSPAFFSSDGKSVVWATEGGLVVESISGSPLAKLVGRFPNVWAAALSPDGKRIVFENVRFGREGSAGLYYGEFGSGSVELIVPESPSKTSQISGLGWSPDGKNIVYGTDGVIYKMDMETRSVDSFARGTNVSWSPDGKWISFVAEDGSVRMLRPNGTGMRVVLRGLRVLSGLNWSPGSEYAVFGEEYTPRPMELLRRPVGSSARLTVLRLRDGSRLPVFWFGAKGGDPSRFSWIYDYDHFCVEPHYNPDAGR